MDDADSERGQSLRDAKTVGRLSEYDQSPRGDFPEKSGICPDGYRAALGYTARVVFFSEWLSQKTAPRGLIPFGAPSKESEFCSLQADAAIRIAPNLQTEVHQLHNNPHTITPWCRSRGRPDNQP